MQTEQAVQQVNGLNVEQLFGTIDAVKANPTLGAFKFRVRNEWLEGGHNRSTIKDFYGVGQEDATRSHAFVLDADEPAVLLGRDRGANPVEYLLHALTACVTTSMVVHAAAKGIAIEEVESRLEGDIDLNGFLGISDEVRNGYQEIRMTFRVKADAPDDVLDELVQMGTRFSPVFDSVTRGVPVSVVRAK